MNEKQKKIAELEQEAMQLNRQCASMLATIGKLTAETDDSECDQSDCDEQSEDDLAESKRETKRYANVKSSYELIEEIKKRYRDIRSGEIIPYLSTGFDAIDDILGGGLKSDRSLYIIGARPAMGKTTFALNIANNLTRYGNVLFVSAEQSSQQVGEKLLSIITSKRQKHFIDVSEVMLNREISSALKKIESSPGRIYVTDSCRTATRDIEIIASNIHDLKCICIDYLGLIASSKGNRKNDNMRAYEETTAVSNEIRLLSSKFNIPVVCVSQLNRALEARKDKRPVLSDLRDSGSIEQDADVVMALYRESYYDHGIHKDDVELIVDVLKNRYGANGSVSLSYNLPTGNITDEHD